MPKHSSSSISSDNNDTQMEPKKNKCESDSIKRDPYPLRCSSFSKRVKCAKDQILEDGVTELAIKKTCHQCRQCTTRFVAVCKNKRNSKLCRCNFCQKCLLNRYGEKAEEVDLLSDWKCPSCRDICNCSFCMKKKGTQPTGILVHAAKATGFSSVSEMLIAKETESLSVTNEVKDVVTSPKKPIASCKEPVVASPRKDGKVNSFAGNSDPILQTHTCMKECVVASPKKGGKENVFAGKHDPNWKENFLNSDFGAKKVGLSKRKYIEKNDGNGSVCQERNQTLKNENISKSKILEETKSKSNKNEDERRDQNNVAETNSSIESFAVKEGAQTSMKEEKIGAIKNDGNSSVCQERNQTLKNVIISKLKILEETKSKSNKNGDEKRDQHVVAEIKSSMESFAVEEGAQTSMKEEKIWAASKKTDSQNADAPLPQGNDLTNVAGIDLPVEDVGNALQFLEFCTAFGQFFHMKKGQPESILRELTRGCSRRNRTQYSSLVQFHIQLLSLLLKDSGETSLSLSPTTSGGYTWLQALRKCITESECKFEEMPSNCFNKDGSGYAMLESSKKLRLLNFLCDEVLCTADLRMWIDEQNSKLIEKEKEVKQQVLIAKDKEKRAKQQMQEEMEKAIVDGKPLSISEHDNLLSKMKMKSDNAHCEVLEAIKKIPKNKQRSDSIRTEPLLFDGKGHVFWRLKCYSSQRDILVQDFGSLDSVTSEEKWLKYDDEQHGMIEKYIYLQGERGLGLKKFRSKDV
ncbi:Cell division cycle-associated 7-like protein [Thalictrum thalictroides]|uniref:Cell division cycle-associated 7-like protein n=1 Tax=Thalictrum thalictroides TaxID=46969 RepID=A0A7J6UTT2_THATH|nr:Cell division cycle-associated 7-like protein [Thalictrum thalictroides]